MSAGAKVYSERLGAISDVQLEAVAERWGLGRLVGAEPTTSGLFGQNLFLTTSEGAFVLRGAPHWVKRIGEAAWRREDRWQFTKERWFAQQLHERTQTPVPWQMLHDQSDDIFGWPYLVMPRMPGHCFGEREILTALSAEDRHGVAVALGAALAEMQTLTSPFAGDFDVDTIVLTPFADGAVSHLVAQARGHAAEAMARGALTADDLGWIEDAGQRAQEAGARPNTYLHCDYKLNNLTVGKTEAGWRVTGLFDFHEAQLGDGALDIVRQACSYLDTEPALARVFVAAYLERVPADPRLKELMPFYAISDRLKFWGFFTVPGNEAAWTKGKTFRRWASRYVDVVLKLL
ncbi:MAG TPA: aminoglycoside phosphotransferase family protein [Rhizomicrobium sp.]|jgi:aminoglycoside phosphotransferase (APT) family kinase protein|nr:aminoglycoside phosphotransferase family protein [Rhizomicrobium sp.]